MSQSPGHAKWPAHQVVETRLDRRMTVEVDGLVVADSADVIRVDEDGHPARFYFPRTDVTLSMLERTGTNSECPFKGHADYYSINIDDKTLKDAVWTFEAPHDEHAALRDRMAFWDDSNPEIQIHPKI